MIKENQRVLNMLNIITDALIVYIAVIPAYALRFKILSGDPSHMVLSYYMTAAILLTPVFLLVYALMGLYESFRSVRYYKELEKLLAANAIVMLLYMVWLFVMKDVHISRWVLVFYYISSTALVGLKRLILRRILRNYRSQGYNLKHVLLVGSGRAAEKYRSAVDSDSSLGITISGCITDSMPPEGIIKLGDFDDLDEVLARRNYDEVVAALDAAQLDKIKDIISACEKSGTKLSLIPFYFEYMPSHPYIDEVGGVQLINLRRIPLDNLANAFLKRAMDIFGSICAIILLSPLMLIAAVGVRMSSPGPVIFKQVRVGRNKKKFTMYKFRSMKMNTAETSGWTTDTDPRKTKFGSFIRKFSIDELPQFFNVLRGDMSLVGPRPELPHFVEQFKESVPLYMVKHQVRPGITGWAQVCGYRGDTSIPERIKHDIYYIENWSLLLDIKILILTVFKGFVNSEKIK